MNNARRKAISTIIHSINDLNEKFSASVDELHNKIEAVQDDEQEALDNMPESMEGSSVTQLWNLQSNPCNPPWTRWIMPSQTWMNPCRRPSLPLRKPVPDR